MRDKSMTLKCIRRQNSLKFDVRTKKKEQVEGALIFVTNGEYEKRHYIHSFFLFSLFVITRTDVPR